MSHKVIIFCHGAWCHVESVADEFTAHLTARDLRKDSGRPVRVARNGSTDDQARRHCCADFSGRSSVLLHARSESGGRDVRDGLYPRSRLRIVGG